MAELQRPILPRHLFRFRSLTRSTSAIDEEIDSILKNYIFCSQFSKMNDPMEGFYNPSENLKGDQHYTDILNEIVQMKSQLGMACFTETHDNPLMWAHYAGNYTGMCLAYDPKAMIEVLPNTISLIRMAYVDEPPVIYPDEVRNPQTAAFRILSQKRFNWAYEREWRLLVDIEKTEKVRLGRETAVHRIYFGSRVELSSRQKILSKIQGTGIKAYMMAVDGYMHRFEPVNAAAKEQ